MAEGTDFLYPFIEGGERDAGALLIDLARSAIGKAETSATLRAATLEASSRGAASGRRRHGRARSRPAPGCSPSATVAARRMPPRSPRCSPGRPGAWRCRHAAWWTTRPSSPRSATTSGSSWCSLASSSPTPGRATSPWGSRRAARRATSSPRSRWPASVGCSRSVWPATTAARWPPRIRCTTALSCARTACTASRRRRLRSGTSSGWPSSGGWTTDAAIERRGRS